MHCSSYKQELWPKYDSSCNKLEVFSSQVSLCQCIQERELGWVPLFSGSLQTNLEHTFSGLIDTNTDFHRSAGVYVFFFCVCCVAQTLTRHSPCGLSGPICGFRCHALLSFIHCSLQMHRMSKGWERIH